MWIPGLFYIRPSIIALLALAWLTAPAAGAATITVLSPASAAPAPRRWRRYTHSRPA